MMMVSLSVISNGDLDNILLVYKDQSPFLELEKKKLKYESRKMFNAFIELLETMENLPEKLSPFIPRLTQISDMVVDFPSQVADKVEEHGHIMKEKLLAVQNTAANTKLIQNSPKQITHIVRSIHETKDEIKKALNHVQ